MIILTDLSDVLIGGLGDTAKIISQRYGARSAEKCFKRITETKTDFDAVLRGQMNERDYYRIFFTGCNFRFGFNDMSRIFSEVFGLSIPGTLNLYQRIIACPTKFGSDAQLQQGMPDIYIVSDHIKERIPEIKRLHPEIFRVVKDAFWSCEFYALKSERSFFNRLLSWTFGGMDPSELIFIDDNRKNIETAELVGIKSILFTDAISLETTLRNLGFVIAPPTP